MVQNNFVYYKGFKIGEELHVGEGRERYRKMTLDFSNTFSVIVFVFFFRVLKYFLCFKDSDQFIVTSKRNRNCNFV